MTNPVQNDILEYMNIEGLTISLLTHELNQKLSGGRISKIFQPTRLWFVLKISHFPHDYNLSIIMDPTNPLVHLLDSVPENPLEPSSFCMFLRKHLLDGKITAIEQQAGLDRVVHFQIDRREERGQINTKILTLELAGKNSNLILSEAGMILEALRRVGPHNSRIRHIHPGLAYAPPPAPPKINPLLATKNDLLEALASFGSLAVSKAFLKSVAGMGPPSVSELLFRARIQEQIPFDSLAESHKKELAEIFHDFIEPFKTLTYQAFVSLNPSGKLIHLCGFYPSYTQSQDIHSFSSVLAAILYSNSLTPIPKTTRQLEMLRKIRSELDKLQRKLALLQEEELSSRNADEIKRKADLLLANLYRLKPGMNSIEMEDFHADPAPDIHQQCIIELDPSLSPMINIQKYYKKYSKIKRAQEWLNQQIELCLAEITYLETVYLSLEECSRQQELEEIRQELTVSGYWREKQHQSPRTRPSEPRKIVLASGATLYVGRNNRQNDWVTFKLAQPKDLWFHTRNIPGSHVVLRSSDNHVTEQDMKMAAMLAAWFSKARGSGNIPVDYTERRNVKKPSGAKPGFVIYEKQKTIQITPEADQISLLLS